MDCKILQPIYRQNSEQISDGDVHFYRILGDVLAPRPRTPTCSIITAVILSNSEANINYIRDNDTAHPQVIDKYFMKQARQLQPFSGVRRQLELSVAHNWN